MKLIVSARPNVPSILTGLSLFKGRIRSTREPLEDAVDNIIRPSIAENFANESESDGTPWEPLSDVMPYRDALGAQNNPILNVTGELMRHATMKKYWEFEGQISPMASMVGPLDPPQWAIQQYGGTNMGMLGRMGSIPARPYIGIREDQINQIANNIVEFAIGRGIEV